MATHLLSDLDNGPITCSLVDLWNSFNALEKKPAFRSFFLGFSQADLTFKHRAAEMLELLDMYNEQSAEKKDKHSQFMTMSIAQWIFSSNRIEFAGTDTLVETENLIAGQATYGCSETKKKEVMQTFDLIKQTCSSHSELATRQLSLDKLNMWHAQLLSGLMEYPGLFRKVGVVADAMQTSILSKNRKHIYPHHQVVKHATNVLCIITNILTSEIDQITNTQDRLLFTFALAAFVQFHFVDVHPYADGNGRLCRFLSKYYLDSILTLPSLMFNDRSSYLATIINCRTMDPKMAPSPLLLLLLDTAITFYKETLRLMARSYDKFLYATSSEEFFESMEIEEVLQDDRQFLACEFVKLVVGVHELTSPTSGKVYSVKKEMFVADLDML